MWSIFEFFSSLHILEPLRVLEVRNFDLVLPEHDVTPADVPMQPASGVQCLQN